MKKWKAGDKFQLGGKVVYEIEYMDKEGRAHGWCISVNDVPAVPKSKMHPCVPNDVWSKIYTHIKIKRIYRPPTKSRFAYLE